MHIDFAAVSGDVLPKLLVEFCNKETSGKQAPIKGIVRFFV